MRSIVCFVVGRRARGQGVVSALLDAAVVRYACEHGATLLEGYPVDTRRRRITSASADDRKLLMFERAGFEVVAVRRANRTTVLRPIVRRRVDRTRKRAGL